MIRTDALPAALRLLTTRERSEAELAERLKKKGYSEQSVADAMKRCRELGYVDDSRFAYERARTLLQSGRAVGSRLLAELKKHGISEQQALDACKQAGQEFDEKTIFLDILDRRYPDFDYQRADQREKRRVVNYFLRRGFPLALTMTLLKEERTINSDDNRQ